jgi:beta-galactosidase
MAIAKPRRLAYALGDAAELDVYLFNDTGKAASGEVVVSLVSPGGGEAVVARYPAPTQSPDQFSYLLAERVRTPVFAGEGLHRLRVSFAGAVSERELWATGPGPRRSRPVRIGVSGIAKSLRTSWKPRRASRSRISSRAYATTGSSPRA